MTQFGDRYDFAHGIRALLCRTDPSSHAIGQAHPGRIFFAPGATIEIPNESCLAREDWLSAARAAMEIEAAAVSRAARRLDEGCIRAVQLILANPGKESSPALLNQAALFLPIHLGGNRPQGSLVEVRSGRKKQDLLLNVWGQIEQLHDLGHARPGHPAKAG
jgi:hypothetical protein